MNIIQLQVACGFDDEGSAIYTRGAYAVDGIIAIEEAPAGRPVDGVPSDAKCAVTLETGSDTKTVFVANSYEDIVKSLGWFA